VATKTLPADKQVAAPVDTRYLETLLGYNARRVSLKVIELFNIRMAAYGLSPVDFSVLSLIMHNPGITSRQLCSSLNLLPPNLVGKISAMQKRALLVRKPHPGDGRAIGLHLTAEGEAMMTKAESTAAALELESASRLTSSERKTLLRLLQKIYF
jgi:DNA-binding MarR family transcriptional regulator